MSIGEIWIYSAFATYLAVFSGALYLNLNFNTVLVGLIYLAPLVPLGVTPENEVRFLMISCQNCVFGIIELAIFVLTVKPGDATFKRDHVGQLFGHTLPIAVALIGLSFFARSNLDSVTALNLWLVAAVFTVGAVLRVVAIYQIGRLGFKFDIVFRENQTVKIDQFYRWVRHPSYGAMMLVILAYALTAHDILAGTLGLFSAWFGFQFRIYYEEKALLEHFGEEYARYRQRTGMWLPRLSSLFGKFGE